MKKINNELKQILSELQGNILMIGNYDNSIYSINISKDVSNLKGMYRFRIQIGSYGYYNSYIASMTLTKLLLTA